MNEEGAEGARVARPPRMCRDRHGSRITFIHIKPYFAHVPALNDP